MKLPTILHLIKPEEQRTKKVRFKMNTKISFKMKVTIPLILLGLGLTTVSSVLIYKTRANMQQAAGLVKSTDTVLAISAYIHELQKERAKSILYINRKIPLEDLKAQRNIVDKLQDPISKRALLLQQTTINSEIQKNIEKINSIRTLVDNLEDKTQAPDLAKQIGATIESWIHTEMLCADLYHINGLEASLTSVAIFEKAKENMGRLRAAMNGILAANDKISVASVLNITTNRVSIMANLDSPGLLISDKNKAQMSAILQSEDWKYVLSAYDTIISKADLGQYNIEAKTFFETITRVIDQTKKVMDNEATDTKRNISDLNAKETMNFFICVGSILTLFLLCGFISFRFISEISKTLTLTTDSLSVGSGSVANVATVILSASHSLSESAAQQASALQQTTAAVEETSAMIARNADNSKESLKVAEQSKSAVTNGQNAVNSVIKSIHEIAIGNEEIMKQIDESNHETEKIIILISEIVKKTKVINDIVFQTKLLSFNASVEAARAGEQGKGFSVVAEEVGNLAQMSGKAALEISQMLEQSSVQIQTIIESSKEKSKQIMHTGKSKVEAGTKVAEKCRESLDEIVSYVNQVGHLISEISTASQEQATGMNEINKAMRELDSVAQTNNTSAQNTSSSAENLKIQVGELDHAVTDLKTLMTG